MDQGTSILIGIIIILLVLLYLSFRLSLVLARRAICKVISVFRYRFALDYRNARTLEDLGFDFGFKIRLLRDYRPWAFQTLRQANIIRTSIEGMYYLSEETLRANPNIQCAIK